MLKIQGFYIFFALFLASCATPEDFYYLRDAGNEKIADQAVDITASNPTIAIGDQLSIVLFSASTEMNTLINAPNSGGVGQVGNVTAGYFVDEKGEIEFPKMGRIKVAGKKMNAIKETIEKSF